MRVGTKESHVASNIRVLTKRFRQMSVGTTLRKWVCQWAPLSVRGPKISNLDVLGLSIQISSSGNCICSRKAEKWLECLEASCIQSSCRLIFEVMRLGSHCREFIFSRGTKNFRRPSLSLSA